MLSPRTSTWTFLTPPLRSPGLQALLCTHPMYSAVFLNDESVPRSTLDGFALGTESSFQNTAEFIGWVHSRACRPGDLKGENRRHRSSGLKHSCIDMGGDRKLAKMMNYVPNSPPTVLEVQLLLKGNCVLPALLLS